MALINDLYLRVTNFLKRDEEGQGLAEYALILALIAIVAIIALIFLGSQVSKVLSTVGASI
jgi:pilus assembly protein Flp/PilA